MIVLRVLGGLSLEGEGEPVPPAALQRRRLTLLALIALAGERGILRERLAAHLWPGSTRDRARHALDQLLYATRRDLGSDALIATASDLRLNPAVVACDLARFDAAVRDRRHDDAVSQYGGALLDGVVLVESDELQQWIELERERRAQEFRTALESLADTAARGGDMAAAARWWARRAALDPLTGAVAVAYMRALAAARSPAAAVAHARVHAELACAAGALPDPAVEQLACELAAQRLPASAPTIADRVGITPPPAAPVHATPSVVRVEATPPRARRFTRLLWPVGASHTGVFAAGVLIAAASLAPRTPSPERAPETRRPPAVPPVAAMVRPTAGPLPGPDRREAERLPASAEAHVLYLRGRAAWTKRTQAALEEATVHFRAATELDPTYAAAFAGLAESYVMLGYFGFAPEDAMFPKGEAAARRALELDPASGGALAALGQALAWRRAWNEAEQLYRRALVVAPNDALVHQWYALLLAYRGRPREAAEHAGHAARIDPLSVQIANMYGMMLYHTGDLPASLRQYEHTVEAEPDSAWVRRNPWVLSNYARVAAAAGRPVEAVRLATRAADAVPGHPRPLLDLAYAHLRSGDTTAARDAFDRADRTHAHFPAYRALLHALLGEHDAAFRAFAAVHAWPLPAVIQLRNERIFATLREDARFIPVLARLEGARR